MVNCKCAWVGESWADNQRELTDDNECLTIFKKKKRWDVKWCCSVSSWLEWKSLRTSLVDLNTSYWTLVWLLDNFQRSSRESFHDSFKVVLWLKRYLAFSFYISKVCIISTYGAKFSWLWQRILDTIAAITQLKNGRVQKRELGQGRMWCHPIKTSKQTWLL